MEHAGIRPCSIKGITSINEQAARIGRTCRKFCPFDACDLTLAEALFVVKFLLLNILDGFDVDLRAQVLDGFMREMKKDLKLMGPCSSKAEH